MGDREVPAPLLDVVRVVGVHIVDPSDLVREGSYSLPAGYPDHLRDLLSFHEAENPMSHVRKHEVVEGDGFAPETLALARELEPRHLTGAESFS